jgi:hypothetical protein
MGIDPEQRVDVTRDVRVVAREGRRLDAGQGADVGVQPLGHCRNVTADLVELDDAQGLVRAVIFQQGLETLCGGEVFEGQRALAPVLPPEHAGGVRRAVLLRVDACHNTSLPTQL